MFSVFTSSAIDCGFKPYSSLRYGYEIGTFCFSAKHAALRSKSND